jgi:integrase
MPKFAKPWFRPSRECWYITLRGKQHTLGICSEEEAFDRAAVLKKRLKRQPEARLTPAALPAVIDAFLHWLKPRRSAATFEWYRYRLERLARKHPGLPASRLTVEMVEDWVDEYGLSVTSRRNYYRATKKCLRWAARRRMIKRDPIRHLEVPAAEAKEVYLTSADYTKLLSLVADQNFRQLIITTMSCGCRPQESLRVEARHVDLANQRWVFPKSESKNKKLSRVVYLTDQAAETTRRLVAEHPTGKLFRNRNGEPWTPSAVNCAFSRVHIRMGREVMREQRITISDQEIAALIPSLKSSKRVGKRTRPKTPAELRDEAKRKLTCKLARTLAPRWSLYALRHTWATNALQKGVDPLTTAILMGHSDPSTLSKVYQHVALNPAHMLAQAKKAAG